MSIARLVKTVRAILGSIAFAAAAFGTSCGGATTQASEPATADEAPLSCDRDRADCDGDASNGCEALLSRSDAHCGSCGQRCDEGQTCAEARCVPDEPVELTAGWWHACALRRSGRIECWGSNTFGQLGDGTREQRRKPVPVSGIEDAVDVAAGAELTCAVHRGGGVSCWGRNWRGEIPGEAAVALEPVAIDGVEGAASVTVGHGHVCARRADGDVLCWGSNEHGQLLTAADAGGPGEPARIRRLEGVSELRAGEWHTCARLDDGEVRCWGDNHSHQLGAVGASGLHSVEQARGATQIAVGAAFGCARLEDGSLQCWGTSPASLEDERLAELDGVDAIAAGWDNACALVEDEPVRCWGRQEHHLLGPEATVGNRPIAIPGTRGARTVAIGRDFACVLVEPGVRCWGRNDLGQLGDGTLAERGRAQEVSEP